jgi:hypothetical protein
MALAMFSLLTGLAGGLMMMSWSLPRLLTNANWIMFHGPLMISGFLGTLIGLERAVGLRSAWAYFVPFFTGMGGLIWITGVHNATGTLFIVLGSFGLVGVCLVIIRRQPALPAITMGLGAFAWMTGNLLWVTGWSIHRVVLWWGGFLILTIVGERLELTRFLRPAPWGRPLFLPAIGIFLTGLILSGFSQPIGERLTGAGMVLLALWLFRFDIAGRTIKQTGLPRFTAVCLLSGYAWLTTSGLLMMIYAPLDHGLPYDAVLHALFLGFVIAMIFGHAPIIFPAVIGVSMSFQPSFYAHLVLLHLTLLLRIAGDLAGWMPGRQWGGLLNVFVILLFLANTGYAILDGLVKSRHSRESGNPEN